MNEMNNGENNNQNIEQQNMNQNNVVEPVQQQYVQPTEPVNELPKKTNALVVILILLVIGLAGFIVYDKVIKKEENKTNEENITNNNEEVKEPKNYWHMETVSEYEVLTADGNGASVKIVYDYPVLDIDSEYAKELNAATKKLAEDYQTDFINDNPKQFSCDDMSSNTNYFAYIMLNGSKKFINYYDLNSFIVSETDKIITIVYKEDIENLSGDRCDSVPSDNIELVGAIFKETGKMLSQKELVELQGYNYDELYNKIIEAEYKYSTEEENYEETLEKFKEERLDYFEESLKFFVSEGKLYASVGGYYADSPWDYYYDGLKFVPIPLGS